jgi:lysozyme
MAALKESDFDTAAAELLDSRWSTQVGSRAQELATQIKTGKYQE